MKFAGHRVTKFLIHLLFWALFVFISLFVFSDYYWKENPFLQYFAILVLLVYFNNEILLPFFLKKKWYLFYVTIIGLIAVLATQLYCNYFALCGCSLPKCLSDYLWQTLVPLIFFSFIWVLFKYLEKQDEVEEIKKAQVSTELQLLKAQINPHVLFNNLNTIYSYSLETPEKVPQMILMLSDNLKHILHGSGAEKVPLEKELDYIDNYIGFQKIRTQNIKKVVYTKTIQNNNLRIAPLLLITIIENVFKHSSSNSRVFIDIQEENGTLICSCRNKVDPKTTEKNETQIGLKNLKKRLQLLYKDKHELSIAVNEEFSVTLKLELL